MSKQTPEKAKDMASWKPGSDPAGGKDVAAKGDFGVPANANPRERDYVSQNTKRSDPGGAMPRSGEEADGARTTGAGANAGGLGAGSGGDIDTDFVGVGTGGSTIAASPPGGRIGKDASDGSSDEMASGGHAEGRNQTDVGHVGGNHAVRGSTLNRGGDVSTLPDGQGADSTNTAANQNDAFAGEISSGEASGNDEPIDGVE